MLSFVYEGRFSCVQSEKYRKVSLLLKNMHHRSDIVRILREMQYFESSVGSALIPSDRRIFGLPVKEALHRQLTADPLA